MIFLKGMAMGICDIIPGVSGGTVALITGIYERLVTAVGNIRISALTHLATGRKEEFMREFQRMDPWFLVFLLAGIGLAAVIMSRIILFFLEVYSFQTFAFFFGIIVVSSVLIYVQIERADQVVAGLWLIPGLFLGFFIAGLDQSTLGHSLPMVFFTGMLALCAMILPGISGAYITLLMNQYGYLLGALRAFDLPVIIAFVAGGAAGLLVFSRMLTYLLASHHSRTLAFLTGLMLGSTRLLCDMVVSGGGTVMTAFPFAVAGAVLVGGMDVAWRRFGSRRKDQSGNRLE